MQASWRLTPQVPWEGTGSPLSRASLTLYHSAMASSGEAQRFAIRCYFPRTTLTQ